ncbi:MAG: DNA relaxase, partial [Rhizobiaceae bacterium]
MLVLENATRLIVNNQIRDALKREGAIAAQDTRLAILSPASLSEEEKAHARFYSTGQVVRFGRGVAATGIARGAEYRVTGLGRTPKGREVVRLADEDGRSVEWDPRLGNARQVNVFNREDRDLAVGDRIQWRLANSDLALKNAERGTVEAIDSTRASIRWDRSQRLQSVDLSRHKTWDHGYSETVFSSQSKTYDRVYVLAPVNSGMVNGQNFYTAITRARFGVKLWTEDEKRLANKLAQHSGEKASALEGLGRLSRDTAASLSGRHRDSIRARRESQKVSRESRRIDRLLTGSSKQDHRPTVRAAESARQLADVMGSFLESLLRRAATE